MLSPRSHNSEDAEDLDRWSNSSDDEAEARFTDILFSYNNSIIVYIP